MVEYKSNTSISGTGNSETRVNEITGDELALFRNFVVGYESGVIAFDKHDFIYSVSGNTISVSDGICFAYGYFGYCKAKEFNIFPPAVEQYYIIYARIDKSVIPNTVELLIKSNYASPNIGLNTFRQDVLSTVKTGVYEIPLWVFRATNKGVDELAISDKRPLRENIKKVEYSDYANVVEMGNLQDGEFNIQNEATAVTQAITDSSNKVATTAFTDAAIQAEINK